MKRRALIIGAPDAKIQGVYDDMKNYHGFFLSPEGGAWDASEITTLECPTPAAVESEMRNLSVADYSIAVFAGHGEYSTVERATLLQLRPGVLVSENSLKRGAGKHAVIIDACRVRSTTVLKSFAVEAAAVFESARDPLPYRMAFDQHLRKCHEGIAVMYACAIDETAGEEKGSGGVYSATLLEQSNLWAKRSLPSLGIRSISDAHEDAEVAVRSNTGHTQNPRAVFSRTEPHFPWAVAI